MKIVLLFLLMASFCVTVQGAATCRFRDQNYNIGQALPEVNKITCTCVAYNGGARTQCDYSKFDGSSSADFPGK